MFLRKRFAGAFKWLVFGGVAVVIVLALVFAAQLTGQGATSQGLVIAENSIRRAAVQCYALEGVYPPSFEYLRQNYGINTDMALYFVDYRFLGSNLMPDIAVLPRMPGMDEVVE